MAQARSTRQSRAQPVHRACKWTRESHRTAVPAAWMTPTADKKYKVTLTVQARKVKADGNGNESPMEMNDYIDVGVFSGSKDDEKQLYLKREKFTQEKQTFEIIVDEMPTRAGIDPYNKLIDRVSDDNTIDVTKP